MRKVSFTIITVIICMIMVSFVNAELADSSWPKVQYDNMNTGRTTFFGSDITDLNWTFETGNLIESSPVVGPDGTIYVGSNDSNLYALNADGSKKWEYATNKKVASSVALAKDGSIYFGDADGYIYCLNSGGTLKWDNKLNGPALGSPVIDDDGVVYIGCGTRYYAINPSGSFKWSYNAGTTIGTQAALSGDVLYFSSHRSIGSINTDGTFNWWYTPSTGNGGVITSSTPSIGSDGTIYYGCTNGFFRALNPDGTQKWVYDTGESIQSSPAIAPVCDIAGESTMSSSVAYDQLSVPSGLTAYK